jgi:hypothetical protein
MNNIHMYLELTRKDVEVLKRALNVRLRELRFELARADDRSYRAEVRKELDRLENIDEALEGPAVAPDVAKGSRRRAA